MRNIEEFTVEEKANYDKIMSRFLGQDFGPNLECWENSWARDVNGYCVFTLPLMYKKKYKIHRVMCELFHGPPTDNLNCALHSCDNPSCCNPEHLRWGSNLNNAQDREAHGRTFYSQRTHCSYGHEYTAENTKVVKNNHRICILCKRRISNKPNILETRKLYYTTNRSAILEKSRLRYLRNKKAKESLL